MMVWKYWSAALGAALLAQDIDTVVFESDPRQFRLMDQIANPAERRALESVLASRDAAARLHRVNAFLEQHPDSAFLSVAHDLAARSCIELRRPDCLFDNAVRSLRILPENPDLLRLVSQAQSALGQAEASAKNAALARERESRFKAAPPASGQRPAAYAGSAACAGCHGQQHKSWSITGMARMFAPYRAENVFGDFDGKLFAEGGIRPLRDGGRHWFELGRARFTVDYTIGSKWQQAYATRRPNGEIHVFPIQFNRLAGKWINYWKEIDPPASVRHVIARFTGFTQATLYQRNCAPCHTSQLAQQGAALPEFAEPGVNCEMCHGPSAEHVRGMQAGQRVSKPAWEPPVDFKQLDAPRYVRICAQCHRQSAIHQRGPRGEMNYSGVTPEFNSPARSRPYIEFSRRAFYRDGRFRETTFIVEAFERSKCYRVGGAHCGHCHDPHPRDFAANLKALKYVDNPDRMCTQCHPGPDHSKHRKGTEAAQCVSCHMPKIANTAGFLARSHTIDDIPDLEMTRRFGVAESPNACLLCHTGGLPASGR
ncbi:MAG: hypothetical protein FJW39_31380 [Acidobacteria bacterium]|nr:hypothetical protein [Acidobacteriota bacterium]